MRLHIVNDNGNLRVHRAGCRNALREARTLGQEPEWIIEQRDDEAPARATIRNLEAGGFEPGTWREEHLTILPCATKYGPIEETRRLIHKYDPPLPSHDRGQ